MELDDLKQTWKQAEKVQQPQNQNIMELLHQKSYGPIAQLKKRFRKQIFLIIFLVAIIIINLSRNHQIFTDVLFWSYIAFCAGMCIYFYMNYRLVGKMNCMDCMIKENLEHEVATLEKRLKWQLLAVRIAAIFFIVLSEVLPYFDDEPMIEKWHTVPPVFRFLIYAALLTLQYFVGRAVSNRKYGQHLSYLKELVKQMQ